MDCAQAPSTPTLNKMARVRHQSQVVGEFMEWLQQQGYVVCRKYLGENRFLPIFESIEELLARFFDVDLEAAERERRLLLEWARRAESAGVG
jgi:hypothetical protein